MTPSFAFIGFGEAGSTVSETLRAAGVERIATYDILFDDPEKGRPLKQRAAALGVEACGSVGDAVAGADIVYSTVVCKSSLPAAEAAAKHLRPAQFYVDFNSISPGLKRQVAKAIEPSGARFVEASVMSNVPGHGHRVPMLLGGKGARDFMTLIEPLDFNVKFVQEEIGLASATKMVRSIMMKGMEALYLECMRAAEHFGIEQEVLEFGRRVDCRTQLDPELQPRHGADRDSRQAARGRDGPGGGNAAGNPHRPDHGRGDGALSPLVLDAGAERSLRRRAGEGLSRRAGEDPRGRRLRRNASGGDGRVLERGPCITTFDRALDRPVERAALAGLRQIRAAGCGHAAVREDAVLGVVRDADDR